MKTEQPIFLVYGLFDPRNGELRYVGKSSMGLKRPCQHLTASGRFGKRRISKWLNSLYSDGQRVPFVLVLKQCNSESEALSEEVRLIGLFRDNGFNLVNLTEGGEGVSGYKQSPETIAKRVAKVRGCKHSQESVMRVIRFHTGRKRTEEAKQKMREAALRRLPVSEETKRKLSLIRTGKKRGQMPEWWRQKLVDGWKHRPPVSDETRAKKSKAMKLYWNEKRGVKAA